MALSNQDFEKLKSQLQAKKQGGFGSRLGSELKQSFAGVQKTTERGAELFQEGKPVQGAIMSGLGAAGGAVRAAFSPITAALTPAVESILKKSGVSDSETFQNVIKGVDEWAQKNPDLATNTKNLVEVVGSLIGTRAGSSALPSIKSVAKTGKEAVETGLGVTSKAISKTGQTVKETVGGILKPENIMQRVARIPKGAQAKFEQTAKESIGTYLTKRNIFGSTEDISKQLYDRFSTSKAVADKAISELPGTYKATPVKTALKELIARETRVSSPGALSPDFKRTRELVNKFNKEGLSMSEINEVKRLFERNVRLDFVKQNLPEGVAKSTNIDNALREWQFNQAEKLGLKNLPDINKETRLAKQLLDAIGKESAGIQGNNAITLSDWIILSGGDPTAIGGFLTKKAFSSKKLQSFIAEKLYKGEKVDLPKAIKTIPKGDLEDFLKKN